MHNSYWLLLIPTFFLASCSEKQSGTVDRPLVQGLAASPKSFNTEEYAHIESNDFLAVLDQPRSTLAADVDAASYSNCRRFITRGEMPPQEAVRIE